MPGQAALRAASLCGMLSKARRGPGWPLGVLGRALVLILLGATPWSPTGGLCRAHGDDASRTIRGSIVEATPMAVPLEGVEVRATDSSPQRAEGDPWTQTCVSSATGGFQFSGIPPTAVTISIEPTESLDGYCDARPLCVAPGAGNVLLRLRPAGGLEGAVDLTEVRDGLDGRRLRVRASWTCDSAADLGATTTLVADGGKFHFPSVPQGVDVSVALDLGDALAPGLPSALAKGRANAGVVVVRALAGQTLTGTLATRTIEQAPAACRVDLYLESQGRIASRVPLRTLVVPLGAEFKFDRLPSSQFTMEFFGPNREPQKPDGGSAEARAPLLLARMTGVQAGAALGQVQLDLREPHKVRVRVLGDPNERFSLSAWHQGALVAVASAAACDANGVWRGPLVVPSRLSDCVVSAVGSAQRSGVARAADSGPRELVVRLGPSGCVVGRVVRSGWDPVMVQASFGGLYIGTSIVHEDGTFYLCGLPSAECDLSALVRRPISSATGLPSHWSEGEVVARRVAVPAGATGVLLQARAP